MGGGFSEQVPDRPYVWHRFVAVALTGERSIFVLVQDYSNHNGRQGLGV